uniref:Uncharacterized protein n=1 Tax=Caenorhabditis japonica TaxID=281687 RepID=A0A8R1DFY3_CAEJA
MSFQPLGSKPGEESTKQNAEQNKFSETSFAPVEGKGNTFQDGNFHAEPTNHQSTVEKMLEKRLNRCRNGSKTDSYSTFGVHMRQYNPGFGRCSGDSNSTSFYSDLGSDFDSWDSNMPCSSSQANARDAAKNARERTRNYQDTGYISHAPVLTANELSASIGTFSLEESQPDSSVPIKNLRNDTDDEESGENKKAKMKNPLVKSASTSDLPKLWSERCKSIPETKKYIKCYDVWYSEFYYGHLLADMTVNMTSIGKCFECLY